MCAQGRHVLVFGQHSGLLLCGQLRGLDATGSHLGGCRERRPPQGPVYGQQCRRASCPARGSGRPGQREGHGVEGTEEGEPTGPHKDGTSVEAIAVECGHCFMPTEATAGCKQGPSV